MARYHNNVPRYKCHGCDIEMRFEEIMIEGKVRCPNCGAGMFSQGTPCNNNHEFDLSETAANGIFAFRYMGFGEVYSPEIAVLETYQMPILCEKHNTYEIRRMYKLFDGTSSVGCQHPFKLPGLDIVPGGGQIVLPFLSTNRLWINGKEIDFANLHDPVNNRWEYILSKQEVTPC